jgi:hypothetical protein
VGLGCIRNDHRRAPGASVEFRTADSGDERCRRNDDPDLVGARALDRGARRGDRVVAKEDMPRDENRTGEEWRIDVVGAEGGARAAIAEPLSTNVPVESKGSSASQVSTPAWASASRIAAAAGSRPTRPTTAVRAPLRAAASAAFTATPPARTSIGAWITAPWVSCGIVTSSSTSPTHTRSGRIT